MTNFRTETTVDQNETFEVRKEKLRVLVLAPLMVSEMPLCISVSLNQL